MLSNQCLVGQTPGNTSVSETASEASLALPMCDECPVSQLSRESVTQFFYDCISLTLRCPDDTCCLSVTEKGSRRLPPRLAQLIPRVRGDSVSALLSSCSATVPTPCQEGGKSHAVPSGQVVWTPAGRQLLLWVHRCSPRN